MKKLTALFLGLSICLCLWGCNQTMPAIEDHFHSTPETTQQSKDDVIMFDTPVVVAEDEYVKVELLKFYQDSYIWRDFGGAHGTPEKVSSSTDGAAMEKIIVFKVYNKCDHDLELSMNDIYLGNDGASLYLLAANVAPDAGKNVTAPYLIRTGEMETLESMDALYSFEGEFLIWHLDQDGCKQNFHNLAFSVAAAFGN